jgi:hypothetical protein
MKISTAMRNQMVSQYEILLGVNPVLEIRSGSAPNFCEDSDSGTLLASITLPSDWMISPVNGTVSIQGIWSGAGIASGNAGHYRLKTSGGTVHEQGTVYQAGGSGDLGLDNTSIAPNQIVQVTTWTRTQGGQ